MTLELKNQFAHRAVDFAKEPQRMSALKQQNPELFKSMERLIKAQEKQLERVRANGKEKDMDLGF